jgi:glycosyltransferase involved in cell wall biosynthesis
VLTVPNSSGIAVIIPAYNAAPYVDQALASVASQTLPPAAVIVADDASTDDTVERALRWQDLLPLEVVRLKRNVGPGLARHQAILATDLPLLAAFDADDVLLADHLEALWTAYEHAPGIATAQEWDWIPERGIDAERRRRPSPIPTDPTEQLLWVLHANWITNPLFSRALYEQVGGFREEFFWGEDWDLWIRMVRAGAWITGTDHPTLLRRVRNDSLTADKARNAKLAAAVLARAVAESQSPIEREAAERALGVMQAREHYYDARALAQRGHPWRARREAARGLVGAGAAVATHVKIAAGLTSMIAAPRITLQLERATSRYRVFSAEY